MVTRIRESQMHRLVLAVAVLLALAMRVLVPVGFMPAVHDGGIVVQLCSDAGGKAVTLDIGGKAPRDRPSSADGSCLFAAAAGHGFVAVGDPEALVPPPLWQVMLVGGPVAHLTVHRLAAPPPPSHAPPSPRAPRAAA